VSESQNGPSIEDQLTIALMSFVAYVVLTSIIYCIYYFMCGGHKDKDYKSKHINVEVDKLYNRGDTVKGIPKSATLNSINGEQIDSDGEAGENLFSPMNNLEKKITFKKSKELTVPIFKELEDSYMYIMIILALEGDKNSQSNDMCTLFVNINRARLTAMKKNTFTDTADELH